MLASLVSPCLVTFCKLLNFLFLWKIVYDYIHVPLDLRLVPFPAVSDATLPAVFQSSIKDASRMLSQNPLTLLLEA